MNATKTATIHDVAAQFDRLFPDQVDESLSGNGQQEAGHNGFDLHYYESNCRDVDGYETVGWYCYGGNSGNPVMRIKAVDVPRACDLLVAMESCRSIQDVESAFRAAGIGFEAAY